jgi:argininosuccinate synthase
MNPNPRPVVLAFSGGLDTSWCLLHLRRAGHSVVTVTVDTGGFTPDELRSIEARARALGAARHVSVDARERVWREVIATLVRGNVLRGEVYPLSVGAERVTQAAEVARVAREAGAGAVAHGSTGAGNDGIRFDVALSVLAPGLRILAPVRELGITREAEARELREAGFPVEPKTTRYSVNRGLWGTTIGGGETHRSWEEPSEEAWTLTVSPARAPDQPRELVLGWERGLPVSLDDRPLAGPALVAALNELGGAHGVGRGLHVGDTILGIKGRIAFEAPAAVVLIRAHRELEKLVLTPRQQRIKESLAGPYGDWVHEGQLLDPVCRDIEALFLSSQERVTGKVHVSFRPGSLFVEGVESAHSLMAVSRGVYGEAAGEWTPQDALGFSKIVSLTGMFHARAGGK